MRKLIGVSKIVSLLLVTGVVLLWPTCIRANEPTSETNQDMLLLAKGGVDSNISAIRSGKGSVRVTFWSTDNQGKVTEAETSYDVVFSGSSYKYSASTNHIMGNESSIDEQNAVPIQAGFVWNNIVSYDGERVVRYEPGSRRATVNAPQYSRCDLNNYKLDADIVGAGLRDCRASASGIQATGTEIVDGDECIVLAATTTKLLSTGEQSTKTILFWVNIDKGFTVSRVERWAQGGRFREKTLYSVMEAEARQYQGGVWGLAKATYDEFDRKGRDGTGDYYKKVHQVVTFDPEFELNTAVSPEDIEVKLPSGTEVYDQLLDEYYTVP